MFRNLIALAGLVLTSLTSLAQSGDTTSSRAPENMTFVAPESQTATHPGRGTAQTSTVISTTNVGGLLLDAKGTVRGLEIFISPDPGTGLPRKAKHYNLSTLANGQIEHTVEVVVMSRDSSMTQLAYVAQIDDERTRSTQMDMWRSYQMTFRTEGSWVDPKTGAFVSADTPGAVDQVTYLQHMKAKDLRALGVQVADSAPPLWQQWLLLAVQTRLYDLMGRFGLTPKKKP